MRILLKPMSDVLEHRKNLIIKSSRNTTQTNVTSSIIAIGLFSWYIYLSNRYMNVTWFSIYSIIMEIYVIYSMSYNLLFLNNTNKYIKLRCTVRSVMTTRILSIFTLAYGIIVLIKMFM
jgi:hypothetical protein